MPVSYSSVARNLFLLGSSGADAVVNFFKSVDKSPAVAFTEGQFVPKGGIKYNYSDEKYILSGTGLGTDSFGWIEKRDYSDPTSTEEWGVRISPTVYSSALTLNDMELDSSNNLIVIGKFGGVNGDYAIEAPWIAKYSNDGVLDWQSTSNTGDLEYTGITSDSNGNYYACGSTPESGEALAFVEKFDASGNPSWGKSAFVLGRDIVLEKISANSRGEVIAVGYLEDDSANKGYIVKIDTNTGEVLWDRTLERSIVGSAGIIPADVKCTACYIDSNDQIYIVGTVDGNNPVNNGVGEFLIKYTAEGNIVWQRENNTDQYTALDSAPNMIPFDVWSDGETEQTVVLSVEDQGSFALNDSDLFISKYTRNGDIVFRRKISKGGDNLGTAGLDGDSSYYYVVFRDQQISGLDPDRYTFGKVSSSGNGLGTFSYNDGSGSGDDVDYIAISNPENKIGKMSDGSVRNDTSDLMTYPFGANKLVFDDLATHVSNKRRQMDSADSFEYSGSPAIRVADFQELNLLGDVYSGSGDWLDQSGKGNDAVTSITTTTTGGGNTSSENYYDGGGLYPSTTTYSTYGTVVEDVTTTLPYSTSDWTHYGGKARDLQSGGFKITFSDNSASQDFFMGCWIKFDTYDESRQMGIDLDGNYVYWETRSNGKIGIRHNGGSRSDSAETNINDGNWHYISLSRDGNTLAGCVDGSAVVTTTDGVSGNTVPANADFWFFGGSGTSYNIDGKILDPIIAVNYGTSSGTFIPSKPLIDSSFNFNNGNSLTGPFALNPGWNYASPGISLGSSPVTTTNGPTHNAAGYWDFDGTDDEITIDNISHGTSALTYECWVRTANGYSPTDYVSLMSTYDPNPQGFWILLNPTNAYVTAGNDGSVFNVSSTAVNDGNWHHVAATYNNPNVRIYVDGVDVGGLSNAPNNDIPTRTLRIGSMAIAGSADRFLNGEIGEARVYPKALTAAQVYQNYNATRSKYTTSRASTSPRIGPTIVNTNNIFNYDFGNDFCIEKSSNVSTSNYQFILDNATTNGAAFGDGQCVSTGYGKVVVGARGETNGVYTGGGKAYIYNASTGALEVTLTPSDISGNDWNFGNSVAICNCSGKIAVTSNNALYLYDADGTNEIIINESSTLPIIPPGGNTFGNGLAISGNRVWVSDDNVPSGVSYSGTVFCFNAETGAFIYELRPKNILDNFTRYGSVIAAGGGKLAIGAENITHPVTGRSTTGRVYLYDVNGRNEKILEPDILTTSSLFGLDDIAIDYGMIVVGASRQQRYEDPAAIGSGEVYVFDIEGDLKFSIRPSDDPANENNDSFGFGSSVAVSSDRIIVGARYYAGNAGGVAGRAYQFTHKGKELQAWFGIGDGEPVVNGSGFGSSMDAVGGTLVIGAGSGSSDSSGRAYVYPLTGTPSGNILNLSGYSGSFYTGTINGPTFNSAGYFETDGSSDNITIPGLSLSGTGGFTVEIWMKFTGLQSNAGGWNYFLRDEDGLTPPQYEVGVYGNDNYSFIFKQNSINDAVSTVLTQNQWHHICFGVNTSQQLGFIYRDGVYAGGSTNSFSTGVIPLNKLFGNFATNTGLAGQFGEIRGYDDELSGAEVLQNFNATKSKYGL